MKEIKKIFEIGDRVYDHEFKWGTVIKLNDKIYYSVIVEWDNSGNICSFSQCGKIFKASRLARLSFTKYDFISGGFSQKRPIVIPPKDTLTYVKLLRNDSIWHLRYSAGKLDCYGNLLVYPNQLKSNESEAFSTSVYEWSINNPLI